ncbi:MAG: SIS domain-containing protein, partial [Actinomycetia bacterium]|nr:SIS domain-containing protein [Actinomycetes bacterium]
ISQSGTTTDTNRTVDLARSRGASVIAIVNRRGSDLVDKADGVLYTSDGRDVEMSVASTKAFYAQIAAGFLLADALADLIQGVTTPAHERQAVLAGLVALPDAMIETLALQPQIGSAAGRHAPSRRYWAMVGNGANVVAAREIRIKLSELCYKSIACDVTEDKKHIDLSSEPLILVCAAGLSGSNADDVAKEVAIFKAHKAAPIVIATEGEHRFSAALDVIGVPEVHSKLAFVLSTIVGHLFGYEAALAIDASARPLREARGAIEGHV